MSQVFLPKLPLKLHVAWRPQHQAPAGPAAGREVDPQRRRRAVHGSAQGLQTELAQQLEGGARHGGAGLVPLENGLGIGIGNHQFYRD